MNDDITSLVDDLEEELAFNGVLGLYDFTWAQDIGSRPDDHEKILANARLAYDEVLRRHPTAWLGWVTWPGLTPDAVTPAEPDTELDFLLDPDSRDNGPLLVLVVPE